jgi:hypothetical protein
VKVSPIPIEANGLLGRGLSSGYIIQRAWCEIQRADVTQILIQVRSRLLDFILELNERLPGNLNEDQVKEHTNQFDAENFFNHTIFGDNTTILVGSSNTQNVANANLKGNLEALSDLLRKNRVSANDIQSLDAAIQKDLNAASHQYKKYGPAVNDAIDLPPEHVPHLELEFCHFYVFQCSHASGAGGRYFNELCGLNVLYSSRHSSINTWASFKV